MAVYAVVLFHAGLARASGGFIGVDVFFVLSGYLVTQMLTRDMQRAGGVRYGRFYARRIRRLLPASAVMLVVTAVVYSAVAAPGEALASQHSFQASFLYVANWYFINQSTGYFGAAVGQNPVLHVWSLAVEEQFYLLWPLLLGGAFWVGGRRRAARPVVVVRALVGAGAAISLVWALVLQHTNPDRAYYGTDARAYQLLAGAMLALAPGVTVRLRRRVPSGSVPAVVSAMALLALVWLASSALSVGPITRGVGATVLTLAVIASLEWRSSGPAGDILACAPMVYLGRISYATYLWHWPVIVVAVKVVDPSPLSLAAISVVVASGLAALSSALLELPIRRSKVLDRHRFAVIAVGLAVSIVGAVVVIPGLLHEESTSSAAVSSSAGFTPVPASLDLDQVFADKFGEAVDCSDQAPTACTIVQGTGKHILLMGDSNAQMLIPAFKAMAEANDLTLSLAVTAGCAWQRGANTLKAKSPQCASNKDDAYKRVIPALEPDIVFAVNAEYPITVLNQAVMTSSTKASLKQLEAPGRIVVMMEPMVQAPADDPPLACLGAVEFLEDCRFVADTAPSRTDLLYQKLATGQPDVKVANLDQLACPYLPICDPVIGGHVVRWNFQHLARDYAASLGDELTSYFQQQGLLAG